MSSGREDTLTFQLRVRQFYLRFNTSREILIRIILSVIKICSLWKYSVWAAAHFSQIRFYICKRAWGQLKAQSGDGESSRAAPIGSSRSFNLRVANGLSRRPSWAFRNQSTIWGRGLINEQRLIKSAADRKSNSRTAVGGTRVHALCHEWGSGEWLAIMRPDFVCLLECKLIARLVAN